MRFGPAEGPPAGLQLGETWRLPGAKQAQICARCRSPNRRGRSRQNVGHGPAPLCAPLAGLTGGRLSRGHDFRSARPCRPPGQPEKNCNRCNFGDPHCPTTAGSPSPTWSAGSRISRSRAGSAAAPGAGARAADRQAQAGCERCRRGPVLEVELTCCRRGRVGRALAALTLGAWRQSRARPVAAVAEVGEIALPSPGCPSVSPIILRVEIAGRWRRSQRCLQPVGLPLQGAPRCGAAHCGKLSYRPNLTKRYSAYCGQSNQPEGASWRPRLEIFSSPSRRQPA
jgi:hypothetical protein